MRHLKASEQRFLLFCGDLSFENQDESYKSLKSILDGGLEGRPDSVLFYATSNRRHLMSRQMIENERANSIHQGEAVEEKVSLSDRFGMWIGFHNMDQDTYYDIIRGYCVSAGIFSPPFEEVQAKALEWSMTCGGRSGRVAWQFILDLCGGLGIPHDFNLVQEFHRVHRLRPFPHLEMQLRRGNASRLSDRRDDLATLDHGTARHLDLVGMGIGGDQAALVLQKQHVAESLQLVPGIGDDTGFGGANRGSQLCRNVDAVVAHALGDRPIRHHHTTAHRPVEPPPLTRRRLWNRGGAGRTGGRNGRDGCSLGRRRILTAGFRRGRRRGPRQLQHLPDMNDIGGRKIVDADQGAYIDAMHLRDAIDGFAALDGVGRTIRHPQNLSNRQGIGWGQAIGLDETTHRHAMRGGDAINGVATLDHVLPLPAAHRDATARRASPAAIEDGVVKARPRTSRQ